MSPEQLRTALLIAFFLAPVVLMVRVLPKARRTRPQKRTMRTNSDAAPRQSTAPRQRLTTAPLTRSKYGSPYGVKNRPSLTPPGAWQAPTGVKGRNTDELSKAIARLNALTRNLETSSRLIRLIAAKHPDQSIAWCVSKAIADLERDRFRQ